MHHGLLVTLFGITSCNSLNDEIISLAGLTTEETLKAIPNEVLFENCTNEEYLNMLKITKKECSDIIKSKKEICLDDISKKMELQNI